MAAGFRIVASSVAMIHFIEYENYHKSHTIKKKKSSLSKTRKTVLLNRKLKKILKLNRNEVNNLLLR